MSITEKRLQAGEDMWIKQIAALTIQLAWRKYYRWRTSAQNNIMLLCMVG